MIDRGLDVWATRIDRRKLRAPRNRTPKLFQPRLELLEDRVMLSISPGVVSRLLYYDDSFYSDAGNHPGYNHDTAIATDKVALVSGDGKSTFANISTYDKGINGIMVDLTAGFGSHATIGPSDFIFKTSGIGSSGASSNPNTWTTLVTTPTVIVRPGAGSGGSDRVELSWPAGTFLDTWLQVTVTANARTGIVSDDRFYFGSMPGEAAYDMDSDYQFTDANDQFAVRSHGGLAGTDLFDAYGLQGAIENLYDITRDNQIDANDQFAVRQYSVFPFGQLDGVEIVTPAPPTISAALVKDTGPNGLPNSDGITKDPTVSGVILGSSAITSLQVTLNSHAPLEELSLVQSNGSFTIDMSVLTALNGGVAPADGAYTLQFHGIDSQGSGCYTRVSFFLKRSVSAAALPDLVPSSDSGASNTDNITKINTPTISVTAETGSYIWLIVDGYIAGEFTVNPTLEYTLPALSNGTHIIRVRSQDGAGNTTFSPNLSITVSNVLPSVTAAANVTVSADVTPHLNVTASSPLAFSNGAVIHVDVDLNNDGDFADSGELNRTQTLLSPGNNYFQVTPAIPATDPLFGPYMVRIRTRVSDIAGNEGTSAVQSLKIDTLSNNVLKNYVQASDSTYGWTLNSTLTGTGYTNYVYDLRSQSWLTTAEVNLPVWHHWLQIIVPDGAINSSALMYIHGGGNTDGAPTTTNAALVNYAIQNHSVIVDLPMVPSEPLVFTGDPGTSRSEDAIIAYTFNQYITHLGQAGNENWPALLPMVKSAVKAMDAVQAIVPTKVPGGHVDDFVITGYSKRGWTTWLTAAVDNRVKGIIPGVFDNLNVGEQMVHHYGFYGFYAPSLNDYTAFQLPQDSYTDNGLALAPVIDPYRYLTNGRFDDMPKLLINSPGDEFFVPDSAQFYFSDLPGTKNYLRYIPNTGHGLNNVDPVNSTASFYDAVINNRQLPEFSWTVQPDGSIRVQTTTAATQVVMWQATNPNARDFRRSVTGVSYTSSTLTDQGGGVYVASVPTPATGATAFFVQLTFPSAIPGNPYIFTTEIKVASNIPLVAWPFYMPTFSAPGQAASADAPNYGAVVTGLAMQTTASNSQPLIVQPLISQSLAPLVSALVLASEESVTEEFHVLEWPWNEEEPSFSANESEILDATDLLFALDEFS